MPAQTATQTGSDSGAVDGYAPPDRRPPLLAYAVTTMAVRGRGARGHGARQAVGELLVIAYKAAEQKGLG